MGHVHDVTELVKDTMTPSGSAKTASISTILNKPDGYYAHPANLPDYELDHFVFSYSEAQTYKSCERKHYYSFFLKLATPAKSAPLQIGTMGHRLLEVYYKERQRGQSQDDAIKEVDAEFSHIMQRQTEEGNFSGATGTTISLVMRYLAQDPFLNHTVMAAETTYLVPVMDNLVLAMTPDLILDNGHDLTVVDHKFTGRRWDTVKLMMSTQLDIYAAGLRAMGAPVTKKAYNFISTKDGTNLVEKFDSKPDLKTDTILTDLVLTAENIRGNMVDRYPDGEAIRCLDAQTCSWCPFINLCYAEMTQDKDRIRQAKSLLVPNDYGYRGVIDANL